jgi:hypothetical protein
VRDTATFLNAKKNIVLCTVSCDHVRIYTITGIMSRYSVWFSTHTVKIQEASLCYRGIGTDIFKAYMLMAVPMASEFLSFKFEQEELVLSPSRPNRLSKALTQLPVA